MQDNIRIVLTLSILKNKNAVTTDWIEIKLIKFIMLIYQRWSPRGRPWPRGRPRGHILKSLALALASKVKSLALASRPQVLENWPVLGWRTAVFFGMLKGNAILSFIIRLRIQNRVDNK